jgi:AcrR family transcriptional regulator
MPDALQSTPARRPTAPLRPRSQAPKRLCSADRRERLIAVASQLFSARGFSATTTREIANAAGVTEAIIFRHFACKAALYEAILEVKAREAGTERWVNELRDAADSGDDLEVLHRLLALIMEHSQQDPQFLRLMLHAALDHKEMMREFRSRHLAPLYQELVKFVKRGQRAKRFRQDNPHALARVLLAVPSYHALLHTVLGGDTLGHVGSEAADIYARLLLDALSMPGAATPQGVRKPRIAKQ